MFQNRSEAGERLAAVLADEAAGRPVVLALPRGGVPVAAPVARALKAPLGLVLVRKIGAPGNPELAIGAVAEAAGSGSVVTVRNEPLIAALGVDEATFAALRAVKVDELKARHARYMSGRAAVDVAGRTVILVDDGIATGATVRAALTALARSGATRVVLAAPIAAPDAAAALRPLVDRLAILAELADFSAVGQGYAEFEPVEDEKMIAILDTADISGPSRV